MNVPRGQLPDLHEFHHVPVRISAVGDGGPNIPGRAVKDHARLHQTVNPSAEMIGNCFYLVKLFYSIFHKNGGENMSIRILDEKFGGGIVVLNGEFESLVRIH